MAKAFYLSLLSLFAITTFSCGGGSSDGSSSEASSGSGEKMESADVCDLLSSLDLKALFSVNDTTEITIEEGTSSNPNCKATWLAPDHKERTEAYVDKISENAMARLEDPSVEPLSGPVDDGEQFIQLVIHTPRAGNTPQSSFKNVKEDALEDKEGKEREVLPVSEFEMAFYDVDRKQLAVVLDGYLVYVYYAGDGDKKDGAVKIAKAVEERL